MGPRAITGESRGMTAPSLREIGGAGNWKSNYFKSGKYSYTNQRFCHSHWDWQLDDFKQFNLSRVYSKRCPRNLHLRPYYRLRMPRLPSLET